MKKVLAVLFFLLPAAAHAQIVGTLPFQLQNGTTADATQVMADFNKILTDVNANAAKNGVNTDITALTALTTPLTPSQGGTTVYFASTSGGTANAQTVASSTPTGFSLAVGKRVTFIAGFTNTAAMTLNVNSSGATNVYRYTPAGPIALAGGEVVAGNYVEAVYDGTRFLLYTNAATPAFGPLTNLASATTTELGSISSHNVNITGTTTITAFGSTAVATYPVYKLKFAGALTLTYNATSLILPGAANITTAAGDTAEAMYLGSGNWQITNYQRAAGTSVVNPTPLAGAQGLTIQNNSGTPNTSVDVAAAQVVMINPTGNVPIYASAVAVTINATTVGANGLDAGALANATWYYIYLISNGSATAALASTSATAPTMPSGYVYKVRLGAMRTDGSAHFVATKQKGNTTQYAAYQTASTAAPGTTFSAITVVPTYIPPTAVMGSFALAQGAPSGATWLGPDSTKTLNAGSYASATSYGSFGASLFARATFMLEGTTVGWAATGSPALYVTGWVDAVNAS